ncbi:MAG: HAD-IA family hydrolase [Candidatus Izemoplasma sp.]|nr:HAD-IA family hydrolase [Candidatus Izemoplasma sp.]
MIKAIIFDLDDTLISEKDYVVSGFNAVSKYVSNKVEKNTSEQIFEILQNLHNTNPNKVFNRMIDDLNFGSEIDVKELIDVYRSHKPVISFFEGVLPVINKLKDQNYKLGIITDGYFITQKKKLESLNINNLFDEIIMTDELGKEYWKPSVIPFELMSKKLNIHYSEMIYIGDNPRKDFYVSAVHPITTVRIYREGYYKDSNYFQNVKEKFLINKLEELFNIINKVNL